MHSEAKYSASYIPGTSSPSAAKPLSPLSLTYNIDGTITASDPDLQMYFFHGVNLEQGEQNEAISQLTKKKKKKVRLLGHRECIQLGNTNKNDSLKQTEVGKDNDLQVEVTYFPLEKLTGLIPDP